MLANDWIWSAPAIGEDGTVYVGSWNDGYHPGSWGYLHAIGPLDPNVPSAPDINGPNIMLPGIEYKYTFKSTSPIDNELYYWIEWGDNSDTEWIGPYESGETVNLAHKWQTIGRFTIKARAKDTENLWSPWSVLNPKTKSIPNTFYLQFLERFPFLQRLKDILI